jgi:hypothetical protein
MTRSQFSISKDRCPTHPSTCLIAFVESEDNKRHYACPLCERDKKRGVDLLAV